MTTPRSDGAPSGAKEKRPAREYRTGPWTRGLRTAGLIGACAITVWVLIAYSSLPDVVPTHFTLRGEADRSGDRVSVLWLSGIMLVSAVLLAWLSTKPRTFNYPGIVTAENAQRIYREGERMIVWLLVAFVIIYLGLALQLLLGTGMGVVIGGVVATVASLLAGLVRLSGAEGAGT